MQSRSNRARFCLPFPVGVDMVLENQMNRYQRFVGASLKFNGLGGLPVGGGKFLRLAVCDDGVDDVEPAMHPGHAEFDPQRGRAVGHQGVDLFLVKRHFGHHAAVGLTPHGQRGVLKVKRRSEIVVPWIFHLHGEVHRKAVADADSADLNFTDHDAQSGPMVGPS